MSRPLAAFVPLALCTAALPLAAQRPLPHPLQPPAAYVAARDHGTRTADGLPGPRAFTCTADYRIRATLDPATAMIRGHAAITWRNRSPFGTNHVLLHLRQNLHRADARRNLRVEPNEGMTVENVRAGGARLDGDRVVVDGTVLRLDLPERLEAHSSIELAMDFTCPVPPAGGAPRMGHEGDAVFFVAYWYPQMAVRDDVDGWVAEQYLGNSEFYMGHGDYEVELTLPAGYVVHATGELQNAGAVLTDAALAALNDARSGRDTVTVLSADDVAAGRLTRDGGGGPLTWRFTARNVRDFAFGASNCHHWHATTATAGDRAVTIHSAFRREAAAFRDSARHAQHCIEWMSANINPYPWPQMTVFEGVIGGGMEYPMITLCGHEGAAYAQQGLIAHELIHMWFPMQVGSNETAHAWQDEGLTHFLTTYVQHDFWRGPGSPGSQILEHYRLGARLADVAEPILRHGDHYVTDEGYGYCSYTKPAAVLLQLAGMYGRERVIGALSDYAKAWQYRHPTPWDFFARMNGALGADLDWYWRTWCQETWTLDHAVAGVELTFDATIVRIEDRGLAPHRCVVRAQFDGDRTEEQTVPVSHWLSGTRTAELRFAAGAREITIDPEGGSLDLDARNNRWQAK